MHFVLFFIQLFSLRRIGLHGGAVNCADTPHSSRPGPPSPLCFPPLPRSRATGPQKRKKAARFLLPPVRGEVLPHREAVKPPLFVPVFRDRLLGELCDGQPIRFDPGEDRLDDVWGKAVQGKNAGHVAGLQAELL